MMLAQTRIEDPKYVARSLLAAISTASVVVPDTSTRRMSARRPIGFPSDPTPA